MKTLKPSKKSDEDFDFFTQVDLHWLGVELGVDIKSDIHGYSARECWFALDTHGETLPCREPNLLNLAKTGKASWNAQIQMWAEDVANGLLFQWELIDYCHGLPSWIFNATMTQAAKLYQQKEGWLPSFRKVWTVKNQWIPPWMRDFDPVI